MRSTISHIIKLITILILVFSSTMTNAKPYRVKITLYMTKQPRHFTEIVARVPVNDTVEVIETVNNEWFKVKYKGDIGYANKAYLENIPIKQQTTTKTTPKQTSKTKANANTTQTLNDIKTTPYTVTATSLYIRKAPSTQSGIIGQVVQNDTVHVISSAGNGWLKVNYNGKTGYAFSEYLQYAPQQPPQPAEEYEESFIYNFFSGYADSTLFWAFVIIFVVMGIVGKIINHNILSLLCFLAIAISYVGYVMIADDCCWYMNFDDNGFLLYVFYLILLVIFISAIFSFSLSALKGIFYIFDFPIPAILLTIIGLCGGFGTLALVGNFMMNHTEAGIITLLLCIPSTKKFIGTFTDSDGNVWDVYRE